MPTWAVISLVVTGALLVFAGIGVGVYFGWKAFIRKRLLRLVVRTEAIEAAGQALMETVARLAEGDDADLAEFAADPESSERRALHEVSTRAHLIAYELDRMSLPRSLVPVTEALADAAVVIDVEAAKVNDAHIGGPALDALAGVDLARVGAYMTSGRNRLNEECTTHGLDDMAVYGGGLYL